MYPKMSLMRYFGGESSMKNTVHKLFTLAVCGMTILISGCQSNDQATYQQQSPCQVRSESGQMTPCQARQMRQQDAVRQSEVQTTTTETMLYERTSPAPKNGISQSTPYFEQEKVSAKSHTRVTSQGLQQEIVEVETQKTRLQEQIAALEAEQKTLEERKTKVEERIAVQGDETAVRDWVVSDGATLRAILTQWAEQSGWRLIWNMDRDYNVSAGAVFRGRFVDVSAALLRSFARATPAPKGVFYKGNKVLVISTREDENAE